MELDPSFEVQLTKIGALKNLTANREWFEESLQLSRRAVEFGREEMDRELDRIVNGCDDSSD